MLHLFRRCSLFPCIKAVPSALLASVVLASGALAQVLVGDPFASPYSGWVDAFPAPIRAGNWRLSLHEPTLMDTNNANPPTSGATTNDGTYEPDVLIQNNFVAPANYNLNATMRTNDDDIIGLVWNYQDPNNYFRVGIRQQAAGSFGGTQGLSVQKIVNGTLTQLVPSVVGPGLPSPIDQAMIDNRTPFDMRVAVNGSNYEIFFNNVSVTSGTDSDLATGRKIGFQSWAQQADAAGVTPFWGTEVESVSVTQGANTLYSQTFDARPHQWRQLVMTNQNGVSTTTTASKDDIGNFGLDINDPWIFQHSNGFENATFGNVDFIGPAVVIDEPGSSSFSNYQMQTRIGTTDNDGIGVLVRVQDDNNFYRITFTNQGTGSGTDRSPQGMSVQKVRNGVWSELYRDDTNPLFIYTPSPAGTNPNDSNFTSFDLSVGAVGNALKIQVRDHLGNVTTYPLITDNSDPILAGTVGFQTWGTDTVYYSSYGDADGPLLTELATFTEFDVSINRTSGNITLTNNTGTPVDIRGITITSSAGALDPASWMPVANFYDEPPGNMSVDPDDPWTIVSSTEFNLSEAEQSGGDGGTLGIGQSVNLGNAWMQSQIEDIAVDLQLADGSFSTAEVMYSGAPVARADLNTDGVVNASDWPLFFPNMLADLSAFTDVGRALRGDLDLDGDNDVDDFSLFKADFDAANGAGAFQAMLAGVPEPSSIALVLGGLAALMFRRNRSAKLLAFVLAASAQFSLQERAVALPLDLTTFTVENFPHADSNTDPTNDFFPQAIWDITPTTASHNVNADASVLYSPDSALNKRFLGYVTPGTDDDVIGFVLGFEPGDAQIFSSADYLLIDWKGADQGNFDFMDFGGINFHHDQTPAGPMPDGLSLLRVTGSPTADEFWQHANYEIENPSGGVEELARGTTLGSTGYNRTGGSHLVDISYTPTNVTVRIDGVEQFNQNGAFPDGRFGLYSAWQGPTATFSNFETVPLDFGGLSATVDRSTGEITLENDGGSPLDFDYYQFHSASNSLDTTDWFSLSDQNFQNVGAGTHQKWQEAGGSDSAQIAEVYLASQSMLAPSGSIGSSVSIGNAYNNLINGEDLVLQFRLPSGLVLEGEVNYIGEAPVLAGDYNGNGVVDAADYTVWRDTLGSTTSLDADGNGNGSVDSGDYTVWKTNFGMGSAGSGAMANAAAVPEPAALSVVLSFAMAIGTSLARRLPHRARL